MDITTNTQPENFTEEKLEKRSYTSARQNAISEVLDLLTEHKGTSENDALDALIAKVQALRTSKMVAPKAEKTAKTPKCKSGIYAGIVGEGEDQKLTIAHYPATFTVESQKSVFTHLWGPFNTRSGAEYSMKNGVNPKHQVF